MNRDNGLPRSGRTGHSRRTGVVAFNELPLLRMQEDRPFVPGRIQRLRQFVDAGDDAEPALRIRMRKRVGRRCNPRHLRCAAGGQLQHRFHGFGRQVGSQGQQAIFIGLPHIVQPLFGHAISQQLLIRHAKQWTTHLPRCGFSLDVRGNHDFADRLAQLDHLRSAGRRMGFEFPPFGPTVGAIVVIDVAEQQRLIGSVDDQADISVHADRPEPLVFRAIELVEAEARCRRIQLQVERGRLDRLLLVTGQPGQAVGEGICNQELHGLGG